MPPGRWFSTIVVALLVALAAGGGARAQAGGNAYTVTGVDVDVNAADAVQARQQGIAEARRKAAKMLVERLVAPEDRARVPTLDDASLEGMVRGIEFVRERSAPNRYIATLNVVFSARAGEGVAGRGRRQDRRDRVAAGPGDPAVEGQGRRRAARRPQSPGARRGGRSTRPAAPCR